MSAGNLKSGIDGGLMGSRFFTAMMEMRMVAGFLVVLMVVTAGVLAPSQGLAAMETYKIDPEHTAITFDDRGSEPVPARVPAPNAEPVPGDLGVELLALHLA